MNKTIFLTIFFSLISFVGIYAQAPDGIPDKGRGELYFTDSLDMVGFMATPFTSETAITLDDKCRWFWNGTQWIKHGCADDVDSAGATIEKFTITAVTNAGGDTLGYEYTIIENGVPFSVEHLYPECDEDGEEFSPWVDNGTGLKTNSLTDRIKREGRTTIYDSSGSNVRFDMAPNFNLLRISDRLIASKNGTGNYVSDSFFDLRTNSPTLATDGVSLLIAKSQGIDETTEAEYIRNLNDEPLRKLRDDGLNIAYGGQAIRASKSNSYATPSDNDYREQITIYQAAGAFSAGNTSTESELHIEFEEFDGAIWPYYAGIIQTNNVLGTTADMFIGYSEFVVRNTGGTAQWEIKNVPPELIIDFYISSSSKITMRIKHATKPSLAGLESHLDIFKSRFVTARISQAVFNNGATL